MRLLRKYVNLSVADNDDVEKERREILQEFEDMKKALADKRANCPSVETVKKQVMRAYEYALRGQILEEFDRGKIAKSIESESYLYDLFILSNCVFNSTVQYNATSKLYVAIMRNRWMHLQCDINTRTFLSVDKDAFTIRQCGLILSYRYNLINPLDGLSYIMKHGPVIYDGREIRFGMNIISSHETFGALNIYGCHMKCKIASYNFLYHLCTNTLLYSRNALRTGGSCSCARTRMQELWCHRGKLLQKYKGIILENTQKSDYLSSYDQVVVRNFL